KAIASSMSRTAMPTFSSERLIAPPWRAGVPGQGEKRRCAGTQMCRCSRLRGSARDTDLVLAQFALAATEAAVDPTADAARAAALEGAGIPVHDEAQEEPAGEEPAHEVADPVPADEEGDGHGVDRDRDDEPAQPAYDPLGRRGVAGDQVDGRAVDQHCFGGVPGGEADARGAHLEEPSLEGA